MRNGETIYLDHQSTTPVDSRVLAKMRPYFDSVFGNPHSADHLFGWRAAEAVDEAAARVASLIGADADEIIFTSGATESNNLALLGLGRRAAGGKRKRILLSATEHKSVLAAGRAMHEQLGYIVEHLPVDSKGYLAMPDLKDRLGDDVLLVSVMAVSNEIGTIQDIAHVSEVVRSSGAFFHCDAAQGPCSIDLSSIAFLVDFLSLSGHKMYGPKGIGTLFIRRDLQDRVEPLIYGGGQQRGLRSGTIPVALCAGMGVAAALLASDEGKAERSALRRRSAAFISGLFALPWAIELNGPSDETRHPGNVNIRFSGLAAKDLLGALQPRLAASTGSACASGIEKPSHVLRAIGLTASEADASVRFSLGRGTTDQDVQEAVRIVADALASVTRA